MKIASNICLSLGLLVVGMLVVAYRQQWIVITYPSLSMQHMLSTTPVMTKKTVSLYIWHHDAWHTEKVSLLWSSNNAENLQLLVRRWLILLDDEQMLENPVTLSTAMFSPSGNRAYLSLDHSPLANQEATYTKWMIVESLLKTIRSCDLPLQEIQLLMHHQPLQDDHLDFSKPWPIMGFIR